MDDARIGTKTSDADAYWLKSSYSEAYEDLRYQCYCKTIKEYIDAVLFKF